MQPEQDERVATPTPTTADVRAFWERNPVAAAAIASPPGSREFFEAFDRLRLALDLFSRWLGWFLYARAVK